MNSTSPIRPNFFSPLPKTVKKTPPNSVSPNKPKNYNVAKQLFPNTKQKGGKRKSLKRKNKKNNKTKRR